MRQRSDAPVDVPLVRRATESALRLLHRRLDVSTPTACETATGVRFSLLSGTRLRAGWYMLEVQPGDQCIGAALELQSDREGPIHLLLSSKPVAKRVVRFRHASTSLELRIERQGVTLGHVALAPLTARFAHSRMRAKLQYSGQSPARLTRAERRRSTVSALTGDKAIDTLYRDYSRHLERHVRPVSYAQWRKRYASPECPYKEAPLTTETPTIEIALRHSRTDDQAAADALRVLVETSRGEGIDVAMLGEQSTPDSRRYVLFMDACTRPEPQLISSLVRQLDANTVLCYADHDRIDVDGSRSEPAFKPDWNPELLLSTDYIGDAFLCRSDYPDCLGAAHDGSIESRQRLLARAALELEAHQVRHVADILSSAAEPAVVHDRAALLEPLLANHAQGANVVAGILPGTARVLWPLPAPTASVEVIVPTRDRADVLQTCLDSLFTLTDYPDYRVCVADNDSADSATAAYYAKLAQSRRVRILPCPGPFNYAAINNRAVATSTADIVVLLNNDTEIIHADWLEQLVRLAHREENGCIGAKLYYSNHLIQHAGVIVGVTGVAGHAHRFLPRDADGYGGRLKLAQNVTAVTGACLAVRRQLYRQLGGLDADALAVAYNDVDFCLKAHAAGYRNVWTPAVELYHHESLSRGADDTRAKRARARQEFDTMRERWRLDSFDDPAYNPNLTLDHEDFGLLA